MQVIQWEAARIADEWEAIAERLRPALRQDPTYDMARLYRRLIDGPALLLEVSDGASGLWVVSIEEDKGLVAWTTAIAGRIDGGPKARVAAIRHAVSALEGELAKAGVRAHRLCGRKAWALILPDYAPFDGARNGLEKVL